MHVLRLTSKAGAQLEYLYEDRTLAEQGRDTCKAARNASATCSIFDQAGREVDVDGRDLFAIGLIDAQAEFAAMMRLGQELEALKARMGLVTPRDTAYDNLPRIPPSEMAPPTPGRFAS